MQTLWNRMGIFQAGSVYRGEVGNELEWFRPAEQMH